MRKIASSSRSPLQTIKRFSSCSQTWPPESTRAVHSSGVRRGGRTAGCRSRRKPRWRSCTRVRCLRSSRTKRCKSTAAMDMSPIIRWNGCSGMRSSRRSARGRAKSSGSSSRENYSASPSPTLRCVWFVARGRRRGHRGCSTERTMCEAYRDRSSAMSTNPVRRAGRCESGHASPRSPGNREHAADDSEGDPHNTHAQPCGTDEDSRRAGDGQDEHDDAPDHVQLGPEVQERARDDHQGPEGYCHARERRDETRGNGTDGTRRDEQVPEDGTHQDEETADQGQDERAGRPLLQAISPSSIDCRVLNPVEQTRNRREFGATDFASENL